MNNEVGPKRDLPQVLRGFLVENVVGRGAQRLSQAVKKHIPFINREDPMKALDRELGVPLSQEAELALWKCALDTLPDEFWQKHLASSSPKPEDPSKSVN